MTTPILPAIVLPVHDPAGLLFPFLQRITPELKTIFSRAFISLSPQTAEHQPDYIRLGLDPFFVLNGNQSGSLPGDHYLSGYRSALRLSPPDQVLHLCDIDLVAFALLTDYHDAYLADLQSAARAAREMEPVLFQRSPAAWQTYPQNYYDIEHLLIRTGELLFDRRLDFAWSHMVIRADMLAEILPHIQSHDFGVLIEMILLLRDRLITRDVDWLAWEDPFILDRDPAQLRAERNDSPQETQKRLRGLLPFFQHFLTLVPELNTALKWDKTV